MKSEIAEMFLSTSSNIASKREVFDAWMRRPAGMSKAAAYREIAVRFSLSESTVRRYISELSRYGIGGAPKNRTQGRTVYAWSDEALAFMRAFYLAASREIGGCTMRNAYNRTCVEAQLHGWRVGSEPSAYKHLAQLHPALIEYAHGGTRALDNKFWILRDLSKLRPFQVVVGDQHRFDFWCVDSSGNEFRPECYLWLDMRTRLAYGIAFDHHYTASTVLRALRMGVEQFGRFECTYNDNGSSEKSAWADFVVGNLQVYGMRWGGDIANLYKDEGSGQYLVRDADGNVVMYARDEAEWHRYNRRIFAAVKNAKAKPIERFFSTLEQLLRDMCLPGLVKELILTAPEEEEAARRLEWQRKNGALLSFDEFMVTVARAIDKYNNRVHGSLGRSPVDELNIAIRNGFRQTFLNPSDIEYLFLNRTYLTVSGDRVKLNGRYFVGPALTQEMVTTNRGNLVGLDGRKVEIRFNPDNIDAGVYAVDPRNGDTIVLHMVEAIDMFDNDSMIRETKTKREQIQAVTGAFRALSGNVNVLIDSRPISGRDITPDDFRIPEYTKPIDGRDNTERPSVAKRIAEEGARRVFVTERERYIALLTEQQRGSEIGDKDRLFMTTYEDGMDDEDMRWLAEEIRLNMEA